MTLWWLQGIHFASNIFILRDGVKIYVTRLVALLVLALAWISPMYAQESGQDITVYKSPTCGCCTRWVEYLEDNGFQVETHDIVSMDEVKTKLGLTDNRLKSCHTAVVGDYIVEGHVPVADIEKLLAEQPDIKGLSAPGMPQMSPGMASIDPKGYDVYSFDSEGNIEIFSRY